MTAYSSRPSQPSDFDQRPRPEWMLAPWAGRPMPALSTWASPEIPDTAALHRPWPEMVAAAVAAVALSSVLAGK